MTSRPLPRASLLRRATLSAVVLASGPALTATVRAYPDAPATWGTWVEDSYLGLTPRQLSLTTDPDGRLRLAFINGRPVPSAGTRKQALVMSWRRASGGFRGQELASLSQGLPPGTPWSEGNSSDFVTDEASLKPQRVKIRSVGPDSGAGFSVLTRVIQDHLQASSGLTHSYTGRFFQTPAAFPYFPRAPWSAPAAGYDTVITSPGQVLSAATSLDLSAAGAVTASVTAAEGSGFYPVLSPVYRLAATPLSAPVSGALDDAAANYGRVAGLDCALTDDGRDAYHLVNCAVLTVSQGVRSRLRLVRQRLTSASQAGSVSVAAVTDIATSGSNPNSSLQYAEILLTHADGEPKWIVWTDAGNQEIRMARRLTPVADPADPQLSRRIQAGYQILPALATLASGSDAALDRRDRLHAVWWKPATGQVQYARENAAGVMEGLTLPTPASGPPALTIGPGGYPCIAYPGAVTVNPNESAPLIITVPPGFISAYPGDYEDRDGDGRCGLIERAQGSSDLAAETGTALRALHLTPTLAGGNYFEGGFQVHPDAARESGSPVWLIPDGGDTIRLEPVFSINGMQSFSGGGFTLTDDFVISGRGRYVTVRDTASTSLYPRQFYRLRATRIPGAP